MIGGQMYKTPPSVTICLSLAVASQQFGFLVFSGASMCHACQVTGCTAEKNLLSKFNIKSVTHFTPKSSMSNWYHDLWLLDNDFYLLDNTGFEKANAVEKKKRKRNWNRMTASVLKQRSKHKKVQTKAYLFEHRDTVCKFSGKSALSSHKTTLKQQINS